MTRRVALGLAWTWIALLAIAFAWRWFFPLELEWMEGGVLHQALRLRSGEAIYPAPGPDFVPFLYTPLYPAVLATLGLVLPIDFALGRAVSIAAAVALGWAVFAAVRREGKPAAHAWIAVGLCASGYVFSFRWLDLARPDTLFLALLLWGLVQLRHARGDHRRALIAGVLVAAAFWTKQTAAVFVLASGLAALLVAPRQLPTYAATIAAICGGGMLLGQWITDGWLWTYVYELHQGHAFNRERFTRKTWGMFVHAAPFVVALIAVLIAAAVRRRPLGASAIGRGYWIAMALAGLLVSALGYSTAWAEPNAFIPGVVLGAIACVIVLPDEGKLARVGEVLLSLQMLFALVIEPRYQPIQDRGLSAWRESYVVHDPWLTLPDRATWRRAADLRAELEAASGDVLALHRPWWSVIAGGTGHVGSMGITDVRPDDARAIESTLRAEVRAERYATIWLEGEPPPWLLADLREHYRLDQRRSGSARVRPLSGWMSEAGTTTPYHRDQLRFVPAAERARPDDAIVLADFEDPRADVLSTRGVSRRGIRVPAGRLPWPAGYGGRALWSSGSPQATGEAELALAAEHGGTLELLVGSTAGEAAVAIEIVDAQDQVVAQIEAPAQPHVLEPRVVELPPGSLRLRVRDEDPEAALYLDDVWLRPAP